MKNRIFLYFVLHIVAHNQSNQQDLYQIISWNIWQMDGLKGVIPNSCEPKVIKTSTLFEEIEDIQPCEGCSKDNILKHNGRYCVIKDWTTKDIETGENGKLLRFINLLNK